MLKECKNECKNKINRRDYEPVYYGRLRVFGAERMERTEGWVSRTYRQRTERPAYAFRTQKRSGEAVRFITVLLPAGNAAAHAVEASFRGRFSERGCTLRVKVDGRKYDLKYEL